MSKPGKFVIDQPVKPVDEAGPAPSIAGPLPEYYSCLDNGSSLILRCKKCGKGYKLPASSVHPGNKIALMNHVRTHSELEEL